MTDGLPVALMAAGLVILAIAAVGAWVKSLVETIQSREWGWTAVFLGVGSFAIGLVLFASEGGSR